MKKTCNGCVADNESSCVLGYSRETEYKVFKGFGYAERKPLEQCEKPKTSKECNRLYFEKKKEWV